MSKMTRSGRRIVVAAGMGVAGAAVTALAVVPANAAPTPKYQCAMHVQAKPGDTLNSISKAHAGAKVSLLGQNAGLGLNSKLPVGADVCVG